MKEQFNQLKSILKSPKVKGNEELLGIAIKRLEEQESELVALRAGNAGLATSSMPALPMPVAVSTEVEASVEVTASVSALGP